MHLRTRVCDVAAAAVAVSFDGAVSAVVAGCSHSALQPWPDKVD